MAIRISPRFAPALVPAILLVAACSGEPEPTQAEKEAAAKVPGAPPGAIDDVKAAKATASNVEEKSELMEFAYSYPLEAAQIPRLAEWLDSDRATKRDALVAESRRDQALAKKEGFPYRAHSHLQTWQRVTNTPRFLSLSSEIDTYTGGAHGMTNFDTLIWDRNSGEKRAPLDLFASGSAFDAAIRDDFCAAIKRAKAAKGIRPQGEPDGVFAKCPPASAQTVWLGSSDGRHIDRLTIAIAPYEIGAYAEGDYRINLPVTAKLVAAVKPDYARDFRAGR
ncbi:MULTISPECIES: DUF4163 domain-containing protein [unclassified Sphingopyxis]|uniref:DUF4163 domain-containing protein n=1 Tax=unclassified Sphingopyxis TaxID=2614943 RepID=UPI0007360B1A|nr:MULTISPECIES: DUF4163 domain-containing protein [unclassified Sphingopyxis]KTE40700.1 hypothetical protein ATE62_07175 [Sphingopyxis sp. HIX]KTE83970.1 hypothetical protein ATE72_11510 [Sphingopyxis sp. HXXIV]